MCFLRYFASEVAYGNWLHWDSSKISLLCVFKRDTKEDDEGDEEDKDNEEDKDEEEDNNNFSALGIDRNLRVLWGSQGHTFPSSHPDDDNNNKEENNNEEEINPFNLFNPINPSNPFNPINPN